MAPVGIAVLALALAGEGLCPGHALGEVAGDDGGAGAVQAVRPRAHTGDPHRRFDLAFAAGRYAEAESRLQLAPAGPRKALRQARLALIRGRYAEVERIGRGLTDSHPLRAQTLLGEARLAQGNWTGAADALSIAAATPDGHRARVLLGRLRVDQARIKDAAPLFASLIADYNSGAIDGEHAANLAYVAMAARALHSYHDANEAFALSVRANPRRTETQLEWARLFLDKGDKRQALESVSVALKYNPNHPGALTLRARIAATSGLDFQTAERLVDKALATNPHLADAHVVRASMALRNMQISEAEQHLQAALATNPHHLWALSVRVAARFLDDDTEGQARAEAAVLDISPRHVRMFDVVARYAQWEHRYEDLVAMAKRALALDPLDPTALATLGINLLRTGHEAEGRSALSQAFERDPFNVRVFNLLNLFRETIDPHYVRWQEPPFRIRAHQDERTVLEPYVGPLLREAYQSMTDRYGFTPRGPIDIELFAEREHFAVRTTGLPNIGVQGVCFGSLVTALSPAAGSFNWGQVLWHELSHVFHLQLSHNRVPRWFAEGLAEYETVTARPQWRREQDHALWLARRREQLPKLSELNTAFTRVDSPDKLTAAYYLSYLAVAHLIDRFGFSTVTPALRAWAQGKDTPQVLSEVFGIAPGDADASFEAYLRNRFARYDSDFYIDLPAFSNIGQRARAAEAADADADALSAYALAHIAHRDVDQAITVAQRALALAPSQPQAHFALALAYLAQGHVERAYRCLCAILKAGHDGYELRLMLTRAAGDLGKREEALSHALAAAKRDPDRNEAWGAIVELSTPADRTYAEQAVRALVRIDQHGRIPHMALMVILSRRRAWREVERLGEATLYVHPASPELHRLLGQAYLHLKKPEAALAAFDQALTLRHLRPGALQIARAEALSALDRPDDAQAALSEALLADPDLGAKVRRTREALGLPPLSPKDAD